jgi:hypothetical protein
MFMSPTEFAPNPLPIRFQSTSNPLPILFQSSSNPLPMEADWNQITHGSGLGKAIYLWKRTRESKFRTEADYLMKKWIESKLKAIPVTLSLEKN